MRLRAAVRRVTGKTHHVVGVDFVSDALMPTPAYVEIEPAGDGAFHLLYLSSNGECLTDTWHDTIALAKEQSQFEFEIGDADWKEVH
jgi:hypothetical protein